MRRLFFIALLMLTFSSCVTERPADVGTESVWTHYQLNFNQEDSITTAKVITRFESNIGAKFQLHDHAVLRFNDEPLVWNTLEACYTLEIDSFIGEGQFKYIDVDDRTFLNDIEILQANFPVELDTISRFASYELAWEGPPIGENDNIIVTMRSLENSTVMQYFENAETATEVHINIDFLQQFPNRYSEWELQRRGVNPEVYAPLSGGVVEWTYVPDNQIVYLE